MTRKLMLEKVLTLYCSFKIIFYTRVYYKNELFYSYLIFRDSSHILHSDTYSHTLFESHLKIVEIFLLNENK